MLTANPAYRLVTLLSCLCLVACAAPPTIVRKTRLSAYFMLGKLPQSEVLADERLISQFAIESYAMPFGYLEKQLSAELVDPLWLDPEYRANVRIAAIAVATRYRSVFLSPELAAFRADQPKQYVKEAQALTLRDPVLRARLYYTYALFQLADLQYGFARESLVSAAALLKGAPKNLLHAMIVSAQAAVAQASGDLELATRLHHEAATEATAYFRTWAHPANEWQDYADILLGDMAAAVQARAAPEKVRARWQQLEPILNRQRPEALKYLGFFRAAQLLAAGGLGELALSLIRDWPARRELETKHDFHGVAESVAWRCAFGEVHLLLGSNGDALGFLEYCKKYRPVPDLLLDQKLALVYERQGSTAKAEENYLASRARFESIRDSFKERSEDFAGLTKFFQSVFLRSYHALLRLPLRSGPVSDLAMIERLIVDAEQVRARQFQDQVARIRGHNKPPVLTVDELRRRMAPDEVLLHFVATEEALLLIAMTSEAALAQALPISRADLKHRVDAVATRLARPLLSESLASLEEELQALSRRILPVSVLRSLFAHKRRIVLVPDEVLSAIPFDLLSGAEEGYRPLFADMELLTVPSLSVFSPTRSPLPVGLPFRVLALADPPIPEQLLGTLAPLPEARSEVLDSLGGPQPTIGPCTGLTHCVLLGEAARADFLLKADLSSYSIVHAATHGFLAGRNDLGFDEPAILLAADRARPLPENFVRASQVETLNMNADLVVLSACHSGQGARVVGEGVLALSRAFLLRNRTVLMTLWAVDSRTAEQLVVKFYKHLDPKDRSPAALAHALWESKREYLREQEAGGAGRICQGLKLRSELVEREGDGAEEKSVLCSHPFLWAPFVLLTR